VARKTFLALLFVLSAAATSWPVAADAQFHRGRVVVRSYYSPFFYDSFYDPFFSPWYPYPYGYYPAFARPESDIRVLVTPKEAEVYVDGYYAGIVDDFNGVFQRLRVPPGEHEITLHLAGYRTVTQKLYLAPNSTFKLRYTIEKLAPGETSEPPPAAPTPPPTAVQTAPPPRMEPRSGMPPMGRMPPPPQSPQSPQFPQGPSGPGQASTFGALVIRSQPSGAEIVIDGQRWTGSEGDERLVVQLAEGSHHVEIHKAGYRTFSTDMQVRRGETVPLNVSLTPGGIEPL